MLRRVDPSHGPRAMRHWRFARANITAWLAEADRDGLDAILVTTSGCGTVIKDYGFMLREDRDFAAAPPRFRRWPRTSPSMSAASILRRAQHHDDIVVAYHSACSLQHGQKITQAAERIAFQERIRGERCTREPFVLRFGGDLQHSPA